MSATVITFPVEATLPITGGSPERRSLGDTLQIIARLSPESLELLEAIADDMASNVARGSMTADPFDFSSWPPTLPPRFERKTEELGTFRSGAGNDWRLRLLYHGEWGVEAQFLSSAGAVLARRFDSHGLAMSWAIAERDYLEKAEDA